MTTNTFWRGVSTPARRVRAKIGSPPSAKWWCAGREGEEIDAVAVDAPDGLILLADEDGRAWTTVSGRLGSPSEGYQRLPTTSKIVAER